MIRKLRVFLTLHLIGSFLCASLMVLVFLFFYLTDPFRVILYFSLLLLPDFYLTSLQEKVVLSFFKRVGFLYQDNPHKDEVVEEIMHELIYARPRYLYPIELQTTFLSKFEKQSVITDKCNLKSIQNTIDRITKPRTQSSYIIPALLVLLIAHFYTIHVISFKIHFFLSLAIFFLLVRIVVSRIYTYQILINLAKKYNIKDWK